MWHLWKSFFLFSQNDLTPIYCLSVPGFISSSHSPVACGSAMFPVPCSPFPVPVSPVWSCCGEFLLNFCWRILLPHKWQIATDTDRVYTAWTGQNQSRRGECVCVCLCVCLSARIQLWVCVYTSDKTIRLYGKWIKIEHE